MEPWQSWAAFLAILALIVVYYRSKNQPSGPNRGRPLQRATNAQSIEWSDSEKKSKTKAAKAKPPRKSVKKAGQDVGNKAEADLSAVSSTTGADADDDLSPVQSPSLAAKIADKVPSGKDVSDMLDPKNAPSVMRITESLKPGRPAKPQQKSSESQTKTKKQAQNEKKREAEKAARAAAEVERKKLEEKQRALARESRGEAPRNGVRSSQPPTSNAWNRAAAPAANEPAHGQLLDTIDNTSTASSATNGTAPTPDSTSYSNLPSEEDQMREALAESAWTTVPKGKKKKITKASDELVGEGSDSGVPHEPVPAPVKPTPAPVAKKENAKAASRYEVLSAPITDASHPMDSDWPVV